MWPVRKDVHAFDMLYGIETRPIFHSPSVQPTNACYNIEQPNTGTEMSYSTNKVLSATLVAADAIRSAQRFFKNFFGSVCIVLLSPAVNYYSW